MKNPTLFLCLTISSILCAQTPIQSVRDLPLGTTVTVQGNVLNGSELGLQRFIQDGTAGIACYPGTGSVSFNPQRGDLVQVTGQLSSFNGLLQIDPITAHSNLGSGVLPEPTIIKSSELNEQYEGQLVRLDHSEFFNKGLFFTSNTWRFTSLGRSSQIFLNSGHDLIGQTIPSDFVSLVGIVGQYTQGSGHSGYQLILRDGADLLVNEPVQMTSRVKQRNASQNSFEIYWTTNVPCRGFVEYGPSPVMGNLANDPLATTDHSITLSGFPVPGLWQFLRVGNVLGTDTVYSTVNRHTTMLPSTDEVHLWFSQPVDNSVSQGNDATFLFDALDDSLAAYIDKAQQTLDIAIYNSTSQSVINAVNDAQARGVQVRFIAEAQNSNTALNSLDQGIPLHFRTDGLGSGMHNKFVVIDAAENNEAWVLQGSSNWTSSLFGDANNQFAIQNRSLAEIFTAEFNEMWGSSGAQPDATNARFGPWKKENTPHFLTIGGEEVEVYFSPTESVTDRFIEVINTAEHDVLFSAFSFTEDNIRNAMILSDPQMTLGVRGMIEQVSGSELFTLQSAGIDVASTGNWQGLLHHKYLIADKDVNSTDPVVITGSHNFTNNAKTVNDENILIFHSASIADQYYQDWAARRNEVVGINEHGSDAVLLYPNPSTGLVYLNDIQEVFLFDQLGRMVEHFEELTGTLDLSTYANGHYVLQFANGTRTRLILQK